MDLTLCFFTRAKSYRQNDLSFETFIRVSLIAGGCKSSGRWQ